ncbi:C2 calcium-dependent membrane targeting [Artemisia annua]|uniref:C2 calcium-dependent membrane targeting n=1 Tax=Artemisia annua TaxID=35608 RepID=A0A2U1KZD9_ARTAN|nr:C2 calcium-dependent membrane targeting [Artemisia annua]
MDLCRSLELTLISARSSKNNTSSSDGYAECSILDKTVRASFDKTGASEPIKFTMSDPAEQVLVIQIKAVKNDKTLGKLYVPINYLLEGIRHEGKDKPFVTYQVRGKSKEPGWSIRFSYRFGWNFSNEDYMGVETVFFGGNYTKFECDGVPLPMYDCMYGCIIC